MKKDKKKAAVALPEFLNYRSPAAPSSSPRWRAPAVVAVVISILIVIFSFDFCLTHGHPGESWQLSSWGYSFLADGFMQGQTYLTGDPPPGLLALADPYDPAQNRIFFDHMFGRDTSLFDGHYYYYFGPVPALFLLLVKVCMDTPVFTIGDQYLVFAFSVGLLTAVVLLILRSRRLFFPRAPHWTVAPAIVALMMSLPVTWLLAHPAMLEAAIAGGQCFIFLGLYFAMTALETSKPRCPSLLIAGICWALSWGCRLSLVPAIGAIALLTFLELRGHGKNRRSVSAWIMPAIALATPLTIGAVGMLFYNRARFGSWTQTGWDYQLAWMNHHALAGKGFLVSPRYIPTNLYRYLIELPAFGRNFPYLFIQRGAHGPVRLFHPPDLLALELTGGILWSAPFCLFALGLLVPSKPTGSNESSQFSTAPRELFRWFTRCLLAACVLAMGPVLCGIGSVERYLGDGAPALLMLAVLGAWRLLARTRDGSRSRWNLIGAIVSLATMTAIFGILLLFEA